MTVPFPANNLLPQASQPASRPAPPGRHASHSLPSWVNLCMLRRLPPVQLRGLVATAPVLAMRRVLGKWTLHRSLVGLHAGYRGWVFATSLFALAN